MGSRDAGLISLVVVATIMTVMPGFLVGALAVQAIEDFGVGEATYGWGIGSFFLAAMAGSAAFGRIAQLVGPRTQVLGALVVSAAASLTIAWLADSFAVFVAALAVAGLANSANQTAINLLLSEADLPRLGLAMALKQSGMPLAAMLGGLAVPVIATTVGWRWAYVACGAGAVVAAAAVAGLIEPVGRIDRSSAEPVTQRRALVLAAVGFGFLAFAAGTLTGWLVSSAHEHAGISEQRAGLVLSFGSAVGVSVRLLIGTRIDRSTRAPLAAAAAISTIGAVGLVLLSIRGSTVLIIATILAFGGGWVWPVFTNFGVVRANRDAAASATGVTQTGVYIGVFAGPLVSGYVIQWWGYGPMWILTAVFMAIGAAVTFASSPAFEAAGTPT